MTTHTRQRTTPRWALSFLAALIAALAAILVGNLSPASAAATTETRVGPSAVVVEPLVGPPEHIAAGQRLGNDGQQVVTVVATGVAANSAARACSFAGATTVLMADGSRKPIEDVKVGDKVIATDPETGEQVAKRVEHVFVHDDTVIDLVVDGEVITTTEDHPFWSVTDQRFERADQLSRGEEVLGADGRVTAVSGLELGTAREALAYNLEIEGIHTYHVGDAEILVHNDCGPLLTRQFDEFGNRITNAAPAPRWQTDELASHLGYKPTGRIVQGQMVYRDGRNFIVQDRTSHNGGFWKMGRSVDDLRNQSTRSGTYDFLLQYVGK